MNIAFFLTPKSDVAYLNEGCTLRQGLEKIFHRGYTAIPVLTDEGKYVGTVSEGDFLREIVKDPEKDDISFPMKRAEEKCVRDIYNPKRNPPVRITATLEELMVTAMDNNFVPVIDDRDYFIGIVTRKQLMKYVYDNIVKTPAQ